MSLPISSNLDGFTAIEDSGVEMLVTALRTDEERVSAYLGVSKGEG